MLVLLVTGSRAFSNVGQVWEVLDGIMPDKVIVGDAIGIDRMTAAWCNRRGVACQVFAADWERDGRSAGHLRNAAMVNELAKYREQNHQTHAVAFFALPPNHESPGTTACVHTLHRKNFEPSIYKEEI